MTHLSSGFSHPRVGGPWSYLWYNEKSHSLFDFLTLVRKRETQEISIVVLEETKT
jgi:hypothetical protein